jgi:hypothetical protein
MTEDELERHCLTVLREILPSIFYNLEDAAQILEEIGRLRSQQTHWRSADQFWGEELRVLGNGIIVDGPASLARAALDAYPANRPLLHLIAELGDAEGPQGPDSDAPAPSRNPGRDQASRRNEDKPVLPGAVVVQAPQPQFHTLMLAGSDRYDDFLRVAQRYADSGAEQCYVASGQSAVLIADPGDRIDDILAQLRADMQDWEEDLAVDYLVTDSRPYLVPRIVVHGTDTRAFELRNVPSTTTVSDITRALVVQHYSDNSGRRVRSTMDRVGPGNQSERLDPDQTLADAGIRDGDELRLATEANAGRSVTPALWRESVLRVQIQIRRYAASHPDFVIVETDNDNLPTYYKVEFTALGFAPPSDPDEDPPNPRLQSRHTVHIVLPADFPVRAPAAIFASDVFHPNVLPHRIGDTPPGFACLGALTDSYRPDLDFGTLCQMLVDMAGYVTYETRPASEHAEGYLNVAATRWARSEAGQQRIVDRGGAPIRDDNEATPAKSGGLHLDIAPLDTDWEKYEDEG